MPLSYSRPAQPAQPAQPYNERTVDTKVLKSAQGRTLYANMHHSSSGGDDKAQSNVEERLSGIRDGKPVQEKAATYATQRTLSSPGNMEEEVAPMGSVEKSGENSAFEMTVAEDEEKMMENMTASERAESEAPSEDMNVSSHCTKVLEKFLRRNLQVHPEHMKKRRKELAEAQEKKISANCPFRPEVSGRADRMQGRGKGIYEVLYKHALEKQENMVAFQAEMREEILKKEMKDCTFTPQTNWRSWYSGQARMESDPACDNGEQQQQKRETVPSRARESRSNNEPLSSTKPTNTQPSYANLWNGGTLRHSAAPTPQKIRKSHLLDAAPMQRPSVTYCALEAARKCTTAAQSRYSSRPISCLTSRPTVAANLDASCAGLGRNAEGSAIACTRRSVRRGAGTPTGNVGQSINDANTRRKKNGDADARQLFGRHMQERIAIRAQQRAQNVSVPPTSTAQRTTRTSLRLARNGDAMEPAADESHSCSNSVVFDDNGEQSEDDSFTKRQASGLSEKDWEELTEHLRQRFQNRISENDFNKLRSHFSKQYRELVESSQQPIRNGHDNATANSALITAANNSISDNVDLGTAQHSDSIGNHPASKMNGVPQELLNDDIHVDDDDYDDVVITSPVNMEGTDGANTDDASMKASHAWQEAQQRADLDDDRQDIQACDTGTGSASQFACLSMRLDGLLDVKKGKNAWTERVLMSGNTGSSKANSALYGNLTTMGKPIRLLSPTSSPRDPLETLQNSMSNRVPNLPGATTTIRWQNPAVSTLNRDIDGCNTPPTAREGSCPLMNITATPTRQSPRLVMNNANISVGAATFAWQKPQQPMKNVSINSGTETPTRKSLKSLIQEVNNIRVRAATSVMPAACQQQNSTHVGAAAPIGQSPRHRKTDANISAGASTPSWQSPRQQMSSVSVNVSTAPCAWQYHRPQIGQCVATLMGQSPRSPANSVSVHTATPGRQKSASERTRTSIARAIKNQKQRITDASGVNTGVPALTVLQDVTDWHASPRHQWCAPTRAMTSPRRETLGMQTTLPFEERLPFNWRASIHVNSIADQFHIGSPAFTQPILPSTPRPPASSFITAGHAPLVSFANQPEQRHSVFSEQQSLSDPQHSTSSSERQASAPFSLEHQPPSVSSTSQQKPLYIDSTPSEPFKGFVGVAALARQLAAECRKAGGGRSPIADTVPGKHPATIPTNEGGTLAAIAWD